MANTRLRQRAAGARKGKFHHRFDDGGENLQGELYREGLENPKGVEKTIPHLLRIWRKFYKKRILVSTSKL